MKIRIYLFVTVTIKMKLTSIVSYIRLTQINLNDMSLNDKEILRHLISFHIRTRLVLTL